MIMKKKVLVVDDDDAIIDAVTAALEFKDYEVVTLSDAKKTEPKALEVKPDLILLDYLLAGTDGKTVALGLKQHPELNSTPIIMLSADPNVKTIAKEATVDAYLPKPFGLEELWSMVEKFLSN